MADIDFKEDGSPQTAIDFRPEEEAPPPSTLEAAGRGLVQGATLGFGDEIAGAGNAGIQAVKKGSLQDLVKDYIEERDANRSGNAKAQAAHPYAYGGAEFGGGFVPAAVTGGSLPALAGLGAAASVGTSDSSDPATLAEHGVLGAAGAAAGGKLLEGAEPYLAKAAAPVRKGLANVGDYIADRLSGGAEDLAVNHLNPTRAMVQKMGGPDAARAAAREALDAKAIPFGGKVDQTASNLNDLTDEVGAVKGDIVNSSDAQINPEDIAGQVKNQVIDPLRQTGETQPIADSIQGKTDAFLRQYPGGSMTPAQLEAEKMAVQNNINYGANSNAQTGASRNYARVLKEGVENAVTDPNFPAAKTSFGNLKNASKMADRAAGASGGGLTDLALGTTALAHPNPASVAAAGGRALTKGRLSSAGAVTLDAASDTVRNFAQSNLFTAPQLQKIAASPYFPALKAANAQGGPTGLATAHYVLQQTDPQYQKILKDEQE